MALVVRTIFSIFGAVWDELANETGMVVRLDFVRVIRVGRQGAPGESGRRNSVLTAKG